MKSFWAIFVVLAASLYAGDLRLLYTIDLTHSDEDRFYVRLDVEGFPNDTAIFQFAVTAPGVYEILDPGRFVSEFTARDKEGRTLQVFQSDVNRFIVSDASRLRSLSYKVDDTFDTVLAVYPVNPMCGSNFEADNAVINNTMLMGFFHGHQNARVDVKFIAPPTWKIAGALRRIRGGIFRADSFDELVDSPFLAGEITQLTFQIDKTYIHLHVYSQGRTYDAALLREPLEKMLIAARDFIGFLPVERYTFLFHYRFDTGPVFGALEHNFSSLYVLPEWAEDYMIPVTTGMAAHEFFHIVTPLHIHSNLIQPFDFVNPKPSRHLWLYEGVTEWAADAMQLQARLIGDSTYFERMREKMSRADTFRKDLSLVDLSLRSYDADDDQYGNVYEKGALTAMLLDLRLLELTDGETGLREVMIRLLNKFGRDRPFDDSSFFGIFTRESHPAIHEFLERYVAGTTALPFKEYFSKIGYEFIEEFHTGKTEATVGAFTFDFPGNRVVVTEVDSTDSVSVRLGIAPGDTLLRMNLGTSSLEVGDPSLFEAAGMLPPGFPFEWIVGRDGATATLKGFTGEREIVEHFVIRPMEAPSPQQLALRKRWLRGP